MRQRAGSRVRWAAAVVAVLLSFAVVTGSASAAAPTATTGPATAVGSTTATLTAAVNPGGQSTTWYLEYGTSTSYGSKTPSTNAGSGTTATNVSAALTGLRTGTTYHYRVVAANSAGTSRGLDAVFTTLAPPDVVTGAASSVTASSATLRGTVDPNGRSTSYYFEYGTSTSYGAKTGSKSAGSSTAAQDASAGVSGLLAGHTYHFRIVASSDAGTTAGKDSTFTTSAAPAVATESAASVTPTSAALRGKVTPNGLSTSWWFEYGTTAGYGSKTSAQSAGSGTSPRSVSATVKGLKAATAYHYRLVARNSSGTTAGADQSFSTVGPPAAQTGGPQSVGPDAALLTGSLDTRGRSTTWWFDYGTSTSYGKSTAAKSAGSGAGVQSVTATLTGLAPATVYHYRLVAKSDAGTTTGADATFTTTGVTLTAPAQQVAFGGRVQLAGVVPTHQAGEQVVIFAQQYGGGSFHSVTTVVTGAGGTWTYLARPSIATTYAASWRGGMSATVSIGVRPQVGLTRTRTGRLVVRVSAGRSFAGRVVQVQRRVDGHWSTVRRVRLGAGSRAAFRVRLPKGRSSLRAAFSVNQAGVGFLGATSRVLVVTVRR